MSDVASTTSTSSSGAAPVLVNGIISGIDTTQVIQALLSAYQTPITNLQDQQKTLSSQASDYQTLNSDFQSLQSAAEALNSTSDWNLMTATSSDSSVATATSGAGATPGTLSFSVDALAQGNVLLSSGSVASPAASVSSGSTLLAATGAAALGFSGLSGGSSLALGSHTISVTQSSAAATVTGGTPGTSTTITSGSNDTLEVDVNGTPTTLTLAGESYTPSGLVSAINAAASAANVGLTASLSDGGALELSTNEQGSAASLSVTGGDALGTLGLTSGASGTGADAVVSVDGTTTTLSAINADSTLTLNAPGGTITATVNSAPGVSGSLLSAGSANAALVSTGDGSLSALVSSLNASGLGLSASAVQEASGQYRLQVSANSTGLAGSVSLDSSVLSGGNLGTLNTITAATDAEVTVGGAGGYTLDSSTNTFTNLMQGSAITVAALGSTSVTVAPDASGEASAVSTLVGAANQALSDINSLAGYNESTKTGGPLMGSAVIQGLQQAVLSAFSSSAGSSGLGSSAAVGITLNSSGSLSFNQSTFEQAYAQNPSGVAALFTAGGTFAPSSPSYAGQASLVFSGATTAPGTYAVDVSQSAEQATDTGAVLSGGTVSTGENLTISSGGNNATYAVSAGESLSSVATGLNQAFSQNGLSLSAFVSNGDQLQITSDAYGSAASFSVTSDTAGAGTTGLGGASAGTPVTFTGQDVAGTINGVAATGTGQELSAPTTDPTLQGLSLLVTTPGITGSTEIGSFTYTPGLAQQLVSIAQGASEATTGSLSAAINGLTTQSSGLNGQIANYTSLEQSQETVLTNEFAQMETTLGSLKNEGSELSSQINDLAGF